MVVTTGGAPGAADAAQTPPHQCPGRPPTENVAAPVSAVPRGRPWSRVIFIHTVSLLRQTTRQRLRPTAQPHVPYGPKLRRYSCLHRFLRMPFCLPGMLPRGPLQTKASPPGSFPPAPLREKHLSLYTPAHHLPSIIYCDQTLGQVHYLSCPTLDALVRERLGESVPEGGENQPTHSPGPVSLEVTGQGDPGM